MTQSDIYQYLKGTPNVWVDVMQIAEDVNLTCASTNRCVNRLSLFDSISVRHVPLPGNNGHFRKQVMLKVKNQ